MSHSDQLAGVREGDILAGKYRVDKVLGVGGMGVVVAAHHIQLDDRVAIKFLLPQTLTNEEAVARFAREARAAVKIKSEHVARVSDVGTLETGAPYMVMEYLEGSDLSGWLEQRGALPVEQAVELVLQACEALAEAHSIGIVHRDLKPANLFVIRGPDGMESVKVLDFGISKVTNASGSGASASMTRTSALMGSPLYMSPEQMQSSRDVDARGDLWALGIILYELVGGNTPFGGETMPELILQIMSSPPRPLKTLRPDLPEGLEEVILRCLEKDRGKRYQTVGELAVALLPFGPKRAKLSVERISRVMQQAGMSASALALPPSSVGESPTPADPDGSTARAPERTLQSGTPPAAATPRASQAPLGAPTVGSFGTTLHGKASAGRWMVAAVLAVGVGVGAFFALRGGNEPAASSEAPSAAVGLPSGPPAHLEPSVAAPGLAPAPPPPPTVGEAPSASGFPATSASQAASAKPPAPQDHRPKQPSGTTTARPGGTAAAPRSTVSAPTPAPAPRSLSPASSKPSVPSLGGRL